MFKKLLILAPVILLVAGTVLYFYVRSRRIPEVPFAHVTRQTLVSTLPTNGKVEPVRWEAVRSDTAGEVHTVNVQQGQAVAQGQPLATLEVPGLAAEVQAAEARVAQAQAELSTVEAGGKASELTEIENSLAKARLEKEEAQRDYSSLQRLAEKQAATAVEVASARSRVRQVDLQIEALEKRRAALVGRNDRAVAQARLRDARAALALARTRTEATVIRSPLAGIVYSLAARPGGYVNPGDVVAEVGQLTQLRVHIYVDEPELGRVSAGQPVTITWDALPGRTWTGAVERLPTQVTALGTRQIGEVLATIDNPGRELVPGTNVNAEIRTSVVQNALTMPKEALRRGPGGAGVFRLAERNALQWRPVQTGASSVTRVQVVQGLGEGDSVTLPTDQQLSDGEIVRPVYP